MIDGDVVEVVIMYLTVATGERHEKVLATISGLKTYFQVAAGTEAYHILRSMFTHQKSWESGITRLQNATVRVLRLSEASR